MQAQTGRETSLKTASKTGRENGLKGSRLSLLGHESAGLQGLDLEAWEDTEEVDPEEADRGAEEAKG